MLKARIRRRKQEQADPPDTASPEEFVEATCGLPQESLGSPRQPPPHSCQFPAVVRGTSPRVHVVMLRAVETCVRGRAAQGRTLLRKLRLNAEALSDSDCMTLLRLLDLVRARRTLCVAVCRLALGRADGDISGVALALLPAPRAESFTSW